MEIYPNVIRSFHKDQSIQSKAIKNLVDPRFSLYIQFEILFKN